MEVAIILGSIVFIVSLMVLCDFLFETLSGVEFLNLFALSGYFGFPLIFSIFISGISTRVACRLSL